jgi:O-antigen ligase
MGWYAFCGISALLLFEWQHLFRRAWGALRWTLIAILVIFLILLSSRLLIAVFILLTVPAYLLRLLRSRHKTWGIILAVCVVVGSLSAMLAFTGNPIHTRYRDVMSRDVQIAYLPDYHDTIPRFNNLTLRLFLWRAGMDNVRRHNLWLKGCGNGDEHHIQNARFGELGLTPARQEKYYITIQNMNLHNMYLQSLVMLGIPGLMVFLVIMIAPFFFLRKSRHQRFFFVFFAVSALFMIQESALQTQAGVIFFTYFSCIYWQAVKRPSIPENSARLKR